MPSVTDAVVAVPGGRRLEVVDDDGVGVEDVQALVVGDREGEPAVRADGHDRRDAVLVGELLVLLTEGRRDVHDAGAVVGGDVVGGEHDVRLRVAEVVGERRGVAAPDEVGCP